VNDVVELRIKLDVNGELHEATVKPHWTLLHVLRNVLGFTGAKHGCGTGECGACTVLMDGKAVKSCLVLAPQAEGKRITTIEGVDDGTNLHPLQDAFIEHGAIQCGYCTPGMVLASIDLLEKNPNPTEQEVREAISGILCRCTGYVKIVEAILAAAKEMNQG